MSSSIKIDTQKVKALLAALENKDSDTAAILLDEITHIRESQLYQQLAELSNNLHQTLDDLSFDDNLLSQTKHDIPDVTERLEYVIQATEEATQNTLMAAEQALSNLDNLEESLKIHFSENAFVAVQEKIGSINAEMTNIMLAQSFQDLTGQVLNRVIYIITALEQSLIDLIQRSGHDYDAIPAKLETLQTQKINEAQGIGPNVTSAAKKDSAQSQDDVDDLLSQLGL